MTAALIPLIPHLKVLHVAMLSVWCAGLFALPRMLALHDRAVGQIDYVRIRRATHYGYTLAVTPAAVLAIASGTLLIFLRDVFEVWLFAKLVAVAALVGFHAWVGHIIVNVAETEGVHVPPHPFWPNALLLLPIVAVLGLVLAKPELGEVRVPGWLQEPIGVHLPFDVPSR